MKLGLATRTSDDPRAAALALATEIAAKSPHAIRAAKALFAGVSAVSAEEGLALEERTQRTLMRTPNQIEAVRANLEKRVPSFADIE